MDWADGFLAERDPDGWSPPEGFPAGLAASGAFFQRHAGRVVSHGLEVVLASAERRPQAQQVRDAYLKRRAGRASPVLLLVGYRGSAPPRDPGPGLSAPVPTRLAACGPVGDSPAVLWDLDIGEVERARVSASGWSSTPATSTC